MRRFCPPLPARWHGQAPYAALAEALKHEWDAVPGNPDRDDAWVPKQSVRLVMG